MKMKTSVILGVTQMTFGVCLKAMNAVYFKESLDFFFEFIPMIIFVLSLFGWVSKIKVFFWGAAARKGVRLGCHNPKHETYIKFVLYF